MGKSKCPTCGCETFYVKDPNDEFEVHMFTCEDGNVCFDSESAENPPPIEDDTETYCDNCAWHDSFKKVKIDFL